MNSKETPLENLHNQPDPGLIRIDEVNKEDGPPTSDVNENKLDGEEDETMTKNEGILVQSRDAQDSINNNENCNLMCGQLSCKRTCEDSEQTAAASSLSASPNRDTASAKGKRISGKRNIRNRKNYNGKSPGFAPVDDVEPSLESKSLESTCELSPSDPNVGVEQRNQKHHRDSLFSLIREGFEQTNDARMLPVCLHQIAETYFQEEDYENAMQFIHLERTYHEQLLANLSSIQEQWETKWKNTDSTSLASPKKSDRELSSKEMERLSNLCGSHQDPKISKHKLSASERLFKIQSLTQFIGSDAVHDVICATPEIESRPGSRSTKDREPGATAMTENSLPDDGATGDITKTADHQTVLGLSHMEEQQLLGSDDRSEAHAQSTGTKGRANTVSLCSGDTVKNNKLLQPDATPHRREEPEIEAFPKDYGQVQSGTPVEGKLISAATDYADIGSVAQDGLPGERSPTGCSNSIEQNAQVAHSTEEHCAYAGHVKESLVRNSVHAENTQGSTCVSSLGATQQKCSQDTGRAAQREATVEFIASLLNGDLKGSEDFLAHLDFQEETLSEEEMSPSPGDAILGDNLLSLDELAKRIEVEEVHPPSGLVSILKKRNEREGEKVGQPSAKQTKRKVRFQEADDVLDQEEIGGGSCILLIVLCLATVFLSVGGTALYCTFGDEESSVCKDFAANMDFYYTQTLQGIEELKHWLSVT
ncbi:consortin [Spea bombifrons]|uniref:consortin n=1 Tax=Spea bombifrons TaxID=233779 RepID=UPI00234BC251|nr:consortin [Spea bombifrons]